MEDAKSLLTGIDEKPPQPLFKIPLDEETFSTEEIRFNGVGADGHETFLITRKKYEEFNFCKTAQKPYDLLVGLVLARINHHAKGVLAISSDGDWESDWVEIRERYKSLFDKELENFLPN